ncbi:hypothetical protein NDI56_12585 [Haloarcula sp. S1CR25-12]|uniref:Outer membrane lipoprotein carrier protein LolA n=1 Tax=Haloarcula saliterrae TaxID=2950534 RepID=A0ABU2FD92_9EURY|nr:hypothetical protein [Haloarcula sp. S1CR25-12]MDS0260233.1 hypothetical protein [Haloarcula sp. S1CR25-12]
MRHTLAVVTLVALAGCSGLGLGPSADEQSVTPVPISTPDSSAVDLPGQNGSVDIDRVVARHDAALADRSFHRTVVRAGPQNTRDVWVDRERGVVRVRRTFGPVVDDAILTDGTVYRAASDDPERAYVTEDSDAAVPYVPSQSGGARLRQVLLDGGYQRVDTIRRNDRVLAVVAVDATGRGAGSDPSIAVQSRLAVDADGIIREVDHWERRPDGTVVAFEMTVDTDTERVPVPWWAEDIGLYG